MKKILLTVLVFIFWREDVCCVYMYIKSIKLIMKKVVVEEWMLQLLLLLLLLLLQPPLVLIPVPFPYQFSLLLWQPWIECRTNRPLLDHLPQISGHNSSSKNKKKTINNRLFSCSYMHHTFVNFVRSASFVTLRIWQASSTDMPVLRVKASITASFVPALPLPPLAAAPPFLPASIVQMLKSWTLEINIPTY